MQQGAISISLHVTDELINRLGFTQKPTNVVSIDTFKTKAVFQTVSFDMDAPMKCLVELTDFCYL